MSYFEEHRPAFHPFVVESAQPLRRNQLGAILAVAAHFTADDSPAIITMPTGSGKSAVLAACPFVLGARRVLVVAPGKMLRTQLADDFLKLEDLRRAGVIAVDTLPRIHELAGRISSADDWEKLRAFDVVIATPHTVSPAYDGVTLPPEDLFDVILVDEAHHEPAQTWNELLAAFPFAKKVLTTATPYRTDRLMLNGKHVYTYSVSQAYRDGVFGAVHYAPVIPQEGEDNDLALVRQAELVFERDRLKYQHYILARANSRDHSRALKEMYDRETDLKMEIVNSRNSPGENKAILDSLARGDINGVIAVNMLSEGIDLPRFKIAVLHSAHKSLAITLQFIGRLTRTNAKDVGPATFLAVPTEKVSDELRRLYDEDAAWTEIIPKIADERVQKEIEDKDFISAFRAPETGDPIFATLSLYALRPQHHVKIYEYNGKFSLPTIITPEKGYEQVFRQDSRTGNLSILIYQYKDRPKWIKSDVLTQYNYQLCIIYFDADNRLIFIGSTEKSNAFYDEMVKNFIDIESVDLPSPLSLFLSNKVLHGLKEAKLPNVGLRNVRGNLNESYTIRTGPSADRVLKASDGRLYDRGHVFATGKDGENRANIGFSSAGKVWSNTTDPLADFVRWCKSLASKIRQPGQPKTGTNLDYLGVREPLYSLAGLEAYMVHWNPGLYRGRWRLEIRRKGDSQPFYQDLLETPLIPVFSHASEEHFDFKLDLESTSPITIRYTLSPTLQFQVLDSHFMIEAIDPSGQRFLFEEHLRDFPPAFHCTNGTLVEGRDGIRIDQLNESAFDSSLVTVIDWASQGVDIGDEFTNPNSIHAWLENHLMAGSQTNDIIFYDHGSGEMADFITFSLQENWIDVRLYHVKASGGKLPGERVQDVYEVCGQVTRSVRLRDATATWLIDKIRDREAQQGKRFVRGDLRALVALLQGQDHRLRFHIILVQPGLSKQQISGNTNHVLASAHNYVVDMVYGFGLMGSA